MGRAASSRHRVIERTAFQRRVPKPGEASFSDHRSSSYEGSVKFLNRRSTLQTGELNPPAVIKLEPASAASTRPMEFARIGGRRGKSPWQRIACPIRCDNPAGPPTSTKRRFAPLFEVRLYRGGEARGHAAMTAYVAGLSPLGPPSPRAWQVGPRLAEADLHSGAPAQTWSQSRGAHCHLRSPHTRHQLCDGLEYPAAAARRRSRSSAHRAALLHRCAQVHWPGRPPAHQLPRHLSTPRRSLC